MEVAAEEATQAPPQQAQAEAGPEPGPDADEASSDAVVNGAPSSSSDAVSAEATGAADNVEAGTDEMDIDDSSVAAPADGSYIGDNCLSTPLATESNSPQGTDSAAKGEEPTSMEDMEDGEEGEGHAQGNEAATSQAEEESPDQSISSAMATDSAGAAECTEGTPIANDDESSTMDEDMGGGEGVASSDDVNDISSAAQDTSVNTGISSSTAEGGGDITSSGQAEGGAGGLISSTANGPAEPTDLLPHVAPSDEPDQPLQQLNECGDADTSEMEGAADTAPAVSASMPLLSIGTNGAVLLSPNLANELASTVEGAGGVSSSDADACAAAGQEGAVSSSVSNGAPSLPSADAAHALATLASAALHHHEQTEPEEHKPVIEEDMWYTVGIVTGTTFTVQNYVSDANVDLSNLSLSNLPVLNGYPTTTLEPGTAYKFRVAAINSCGRGEFSEESAFKTCLPGFPGAPSAIKISKSLEGAHLSWEPPQVAAEGIFEYSVYLAVRSNSQPKEASKSQLAFVRVYCGKANTCVVPQASLGAAHVDSSTKPAIIFRIAARNEKGYGPATQVRWLQDTKSTGVKRPGEGRLPGASPSKQPKQMIH